MRPYRVVRSLLGAALALATAAQAAAPTQFVTGAGEVRDFVAVSATTGYAATQGGGVWKTTNAGANWSKLTGLSAKYVWKVSANPNNSARLYAATTSGLYRSTDSGTSWTRLTYDETRTVAVSPGSGAGGPDTLLVGVTGAGILRSTDSGATFTRQSTGLDNLNVTHIVYPPGSTVAAYAVVQCNFETFPSYSGNWGGVFRTINATSGTVSWSPLNSGLPGPVAAPATKPCVTSLAANMNAGSPVIVVGILDPSTTHGGIYRITNANPNSWEASPDNGASLFGVTWLGPDLSNSNGFFAGTHQTGPYRSTNGGVNWASQVTQGTDPDLATQSFAAGAFTSTVWVAGINGYGLFRTTAGGSPWDLPAGPVNADRVNDITNHASVAPGTYYIALENGGVKKSANSGASFAPFNAGLEVNSTFGDFIRNVKVIGAHPGNASVVGLGIRGTHGLFQLSGGTSWLPVAGFTYDVPADHKPQSLVITPAGKVFYSLFDAPSGCCPGGLYSATATGTTLGTLASTGRPLASDANPGLGVGAGSYRVRPSPTAPHIRVFLLTFGAVPYRSMDGGASWARVSTNAATDVGHFFFDIAEKVTAPLTLVASTTKGIFRSSDDGATWGRVSATGLNTTSLSALAYFGGTATLFGGDFSGQLYCSTNDGTTWQQVTGGNLGASIREMKFMNGAIHILTDGGGFWKKDAVCP